MALTAFTSRLSAGQGRVRTANATAGEYAFVLGDVEPGRLFDLALGDHAEVTQAVDVTGIDFVRVSLRFRVPANTPSGLGWEAAIIVDGAKLARLRTRPGRERSMMDLAGNVSKLSGTHTVGVRLELVSA
ncbi:MAG: hypothetical protein JW751_32325 [Polyangiaceae bacterium]|nr:hypothetical protein [Polyangiaceae bacterium]